MEEQRKTDRMDPMDPAHGDGDDRGTEGPAHDEPAPEPEREPNPSTDDPYPAPLWRPMEPASEQTEWIIFQERAGDESAHPALAAARRYLRAGWRTIPLLERS
ncbi:MAG TPA: hypothetical protein VGR57_15230, partial [Ktedonobacterales bacterium]|nr:hypothetical protein [Ktedonobacterales bacterium]